MKKIIPLLIPFSFSCGKDDKKNPESDYDVVKKECFQKGLTFDDATKSCGEEASYGLIENENENEYFVCKGYSNIENFGKYCKVKKDIILERQENTVKIEIEYIYFAEPSPFTQSPLFDKDELKNSPNLHILSVEEGIEKTVEKKPFASGKPVTNKIIIKGQGPFKIIDTNHPLFFNKGYWLNADATFQITNIKIVGSELD